ncbi:MAG: phosphate-binding protein, partial [Clostridia bacterium]|nr:phosphate-binding protein [Clostridia bacterium]
MKKYMSILLLAALLTAALASCGNAPAETEADTAATAVETETMVETDTIEARQAVSDEIQELY